MKFKAQVTKLEKKNQEARPQGGALKPKFLNPKTRSRNKFGMTKRPEPSCHLMLNLLQHLGFFRYIHQTKPSSPSLPTGPGPDRGRGRQAQDGFSCAVLVNSLPLNYFEIHLAFGFWQLDFMDQTR